MQDDRSVKCPRRYTYAGEMITSSEPLGTCHMLAFIGSIWSKRSIIFLLVGMLCAPPAVQAQLSNPSSPVDEYEQSQNRSFDRQVAEQPESGVESLPSWAEPSNTSRRRAEGDTRSKAPGPPGDPPRVPVDGGLLWLVIAGCGYGVHKLFNSHRPVHSSSP